MVSNTCGSRGARCVLCCGAGIVLWGGDHEEFALRGSALDLAIGVIIGTAFGGVVTSLVNDILMPPIGLLLGRVDFSHLFVDLSGAGYGSLAAAQEAGAPTLNYGMFVQTVLDVLIVAAAVFLIVRAVNRLRAPRKDEAPPSVRDRPYCLSQIPVKASRCAFCTAEVEPVIAGGS